MNRVFIIKPVRVKSEMLSVDVLMHSLVCICSLDLIAEVDYEVTGFSCANNGENLRLIFPSA
jgi:hypothetical protein